MDQLRSRSRCSFADPPWRKPLTLTSEPQFVKFAKKARKHLPLWWTNADDKAVLKMSREHDWANIAYAVEKSDINEHYGSGMFAMGLRMWTEKVTGIRIA